MLGPPSFARCCPFMLGGERVPRVPGRGRGELSPEALLLTGGILESPQPIPHPQHQPCPHSPSSVLFAVASPWGRHPSPPPSSLHPRKPLWWRVWQGGLAETPPSPPTGNSNLVYAIIRKRSVFHQLANLPTDPPAIHKALQRRRRPPEPLSRAGSQEGASMEGSRPAVPAEPGTLKTSLVATPGPVLTAGRGCGK